MKAIDMKVASWKSIRPQTPQQQDVRSCSVYVIKVPFTTVCFRYRAVLGEYRTEVLGTAMPLQKKTEGYQSDLIIVTGHLTA